MSVFRTSDDEHQPLTWVGGYALYASHCIVAVFVASMIVASLMMATGAGGLLALATFDSTQVFRGQVWRLFTYGLVNPPMPGWGILGFAIDMFMILWFGRELEKFFGRRIFSWFFAGLYFVTPLLYTLIGLRWPTQLAGQSGAFAMFIAVATLYPNVMMMMLNIPIKWIAGIMIALYSLTALAHHDWLGLISLWTVSAYAWLFVSYQQGRVALPTLAVFQPKPKLRVLPDLKPVKPIAIKAEKESTMAEMDALLDKIARSGLSSLTAKERAQLAKAREEMMKKPGRS